jgi:FtsH-binding integral membrane protein
MTPMLIHTNLHGADVLLRDLQRVNAAFSGITGLAIAVSSGWLSQQVGLPRPLVAVLGVGLVGWSVLLVVLAAQPAERLVRASALVAAGDAVWVIGTLALLVLRDPTATGTTLTIAAAVVVGAFAVAGIVLRERALRHGTTGGQCVTR